MMHLLNGESTIEVEGGAIRIKDVKIGARGKYGGEEIDVAITVNGYRITQESSGQITQYYLDKYFRPCGRIQRKNGDRVLEEVSYKAGELHGICREYSPTTGFLVSEEMWVDGAKHGPSKKFAARDGKLCSQVFYDRGVASGESVTYNMNGTKAGSVMHYMGMRHGSKLAWFADGSLCHAESYQWGLRHGAVTHWFPSGMVSDRGQFYLGRITGPWHHSEHRSITNAPTTTVHDIVMSDPIWAGNITELVDWETIDASD